jgi:hypothetical protein
MAERSFQWPGRRTSDPAHDMLTAFLVMDIQRNPQWACELMDRIAEVKSGKVPVWERTGNAYRLELTDQGALIEDLVDEDGPVQRIIMEEFSAAVEAWVKALEEADS